ncbi:PLC-like phosphodiesterase [Ceratobasidium sp. AG-I]|nr:PLC-like phosphodiesterase [Ceratobasidium sp. AG-I]
MANFDPNKYCSYQGKHRDTLLAVKNDLESIFSSAHILIVHETNHLAFGQGDELARYHLETDDRGVFTSTYGYDVYVLREAVFTYDGDTGAGDFLCETAVQDGNSYTLKTMSGPTGADWMGNLPDTLALSQVTIPGTHDSCSTFDAFDFPLNLWLACQSSGRGIPWQLNAGVRFLDLRCRWDTDKHQMQMVHGNFDAKGTLDELINSTLQFLRVYTRETVIVSIKAEGKGTATPTTNPFADAVCRIIHANQASWYLDTHIPSLGQIRGKIVLFRRYDETNATYLSSTGSIGGLCLPNFPSPSSEIIPQDIYDPSRDDKDEGKAYDDKWAAIVKWFASASSAASPYPLYLNFISGYLNPNLEDTFIGRTPYQFARVMNGRLKAYLDQFDNKQETVNLGVVILDYPDKWSNPGKAEPALITRLWGTNYAS